MTDEWYCKWFEVTPMKTVIGVIKRRFNSFEEAKKYATKIKYADPKIYKFVMTEVAK